MAKLFGFSIENTEPLSPNAVSPVPPNNEDGVDHYLSSGFFGSYVDIEGIYRTEFDLIKRYREMALHPECDSAIEDIVNEAIVSDTNDSPVQIDLDNLVFFYSYFSYAPQQVWKMHIWDHHYSYCLPKSRMM